jgi:hypothetical protein
MVKRYGRAEIDSAGHGSWSGVLLELVGVECRNGTGDANACLPRFDSVSSIPLVLISPVHKQLVTRL